MAFARKIDGLWTEIFGAFVTGDGDDAIQRPPNWCDLATPAERAAVGIVQIQEPDPVPDSMIVEGMELVDVNKRPVRRHIMRQMTAAELSARLQAERAEMVVSMHQARLALLGAGILNNVQSAIDGIADPTARAAAHIDWEYATEVRRLSPLITRLAPALGLNDAEIDDLFSTAAGIS